MSSSSTPHSMLSAINLFSGTVTLSASGAQATLDPRLMQNPGSKAMLIDEIRFVNLNAAGNRNNEYGAYLFTRLRINRQNVTNGYVPVWTLSNQFDLSQNQNNHSNGTRSTYIYRPPRPIYVPKYTNLLCDLRIDPVAVAANSPSIAAAFGVSYVGRQIDDVNLPAPSTVDVPWTTSFLPAPFPASVQTAPIRSTANDLCCPFREPVHVSSLISRTAVTGCVDAFFTDPYIVNKYITYRMSNPQGAIITRDPTPIGHSFDAITREWKMDTTIDQKSYFIMAIGADLRGINVGSPYTNVALHGYRTVSLREYMS